MFHHTVYTKAEHTPCGLFIHSFIFSKALHPDLGHWILSYPGITERQSVTEHHAHTFTHPFTRRGDKTSSASWQVFGRWEETRESGGNPHRHEGEHPQKLHTDRNLTDLRIKQGPSNNVFIYVPRVYELYTNLYLLPHLQGRESKKLPVWQHETICFVIIARWVR